MKEIIKKRAKFRKELDSHKPTFSQSEYKEYIRIHYKTLDKYMGQFNNYLLSFYIDTHIINKIVLRLIIGKDRLYNLLYNSKKITINEVYKIFKYIRLKPEFKDYFIRKTHMTYDIYGRNPSPETNNKKRGNNDIEVTRNKFAEFVYIILSEYIVFHNWMWASKLKPDCVTTVDRFHKNFKV